MGTRHHKIGPCCAGIRARTGLDRTAVGASSLLQTTVHRPTPNAVEIALASGAAKGVSGILDRLLQPILTVRIAASSSDLWGFVGGAIQHELVPSLWQVVDI